MATMRTCRGWSNAATGLSINSPLVVTSVSASHGGEAQAGEAIQIALHLNEAVTINAAGGAPTLTLNDGGTATFNSGASSAATGTLVFDYTVGANGVPDLTVLEVNVPHGTIIEDSNGYNAEFSAALDQGTGLQINPAFVNTLYTNSFHATHAGETLGITLAMSTAVTVNGGAPSLTLSNGATAFFDAAASDPSAGLLVFDYAVGAGGNTRTITT